jgi:hypothetical protein
LFNVEKFVCALAIGDFDFGKYFEMLFILFLEMQEIGDFCYD